MVDFPAARGYGDQSANPASGVDIPEPPALQGGGGKQPVMQVRIAIQALHEALVVEPEPEDKAVISTCLTNLIRLQAKNAKEGGGAAPSR